jgi:hypothetical protein
MSTNTSRRAVMAGAAALAGGAAANAVAIVATRAATRGENPLVADPIYALVGAHRAAYVKRVTSEREAFYLDHGTPEHREWDLIADEDRDAFDAASHALLDAPVITQGAAMALLLYVLDFNDGAVGIEPWADSKWSDWSSNLDQWPRQQLPNDLYDENGEMAWMLMRKVAGFFRGLA